MRESCMCVCGTMEKGSHWVKQTPNESQTRNTRLSLCAAGENYGKQPNSEWKLNSSSNIRETRGKQK